MQTIYIGWDSREQDAYDVCKYSIRRNSKRYYPIVPLKQAELRQRGLYTRPKNEPASTEFTYSRFLVPFLSGYEGVAVFCDCDILFTKDIGELFKLFDDRYAVQVVKHDYIPKDSIKMDGQTQVSYPKKNWSSVYIVNCSHPSVQKLTPELVNKESGAYLHRFEWLKDDEIGELPIVWNYLVGEYPYKEDIAYAYHYTLGGPWFKGYENCDYSDLWLNYYKEMSGNEYVV